MYWLGPRSQELVGAAVGGGGGSGGGMALCVKGGGGARLYATLHCHHYI